MDVTSALRAICSTGKGRCWHCDVKLPEAERAISEGWDVQRIEEHPAASIILICPSCRQRNAGSKRVRMSRASSRRSTAPSGLEPAAQNP